ncbi:MAG: endonuclease III [Spirochaetales bacterium]|nr:endonuclease III [Spirochaetales bacterium]
MNPKKIKWEEIFTGLEIFMKNQAKPSISLIAEINNDPYRVLFSTIISLRTRDEVTITASSRLFEAAPNLESLAKLTEENVAQLIYPAAFYRNKSASILKCAAILQAEYNGKVPGDRELLLKLPGVGRKTANLTLNLGFGVNAICVDTHVHRISNRMGWVTTGAPEATEAALEIILPENYWIPLNEMLVSYGQKICTPLSPRCSICGVTKHCRRIGVERSR